MKTEGKKSRKKQEAGPRPERETTLPERRAIAPDDEEGGRPDFGGLPTRDLKKNLGCG